MDAAAAVGLGGFMWRFRRRPLVVRGTEVDRGLEEEEGATDAAGCVEVVPPPSADRDEADVVPCAPDPVATDADWARWGPAEEEGDERGGSCLPAPRMLGLSSDEEVEEEGRRPPPVPPPTPPPAAAPALCPEAAAVAVPLPGRGETMEVA